MTLPETRNPRLLCTRADTTPVKARSPAPAGCTTVISTSWVVVLGSSAEWEGWQAVRFKLATHSPPARARVPTRNMVALLRSREKPDCREESGSRCAYGDSLLNEMPVCSESSSLYAVNGQNGFQILQVSPGTTNALRFSTTASGRSRGRK